MPSKSILKKKLENAKKKVTLVDGPEYKYHKTIERQSYHPVGGFLTTTYEFEDNSAEEDEEEDEEDKEITFTTFNSLRDEVSSVFVAGIKSVRKRIVHSIFNEIRNWKFYKYKNFGSQILARNCEKISLNVKREIFQSFRHNYLEVHRVRNKLSRFTNIIVRRKHVERSKVFSILKIYSKTKHLHNQCGIRNLLMIRTLEKIFDNCQKQKKTLSFSNIVRRSEIVSMREEWRIIESRNRQKWISELEAKEKSRQDFESRERSKMEKEFIFRLNKEKESWVIEETGRMRLYSANQNYNRIKIFAQTFLKTIEKNVKKKSMGRITEFIALQKETELIKELGIEKIMRILSNKTNLSNDYIFKSLQISGKKRKMRVKYRKIQGSIKICHILRKISLFSIFKSFSSIIIQSLMLSNQLKSDIEYKDKGTNVHLLSDSVEKEKRSNLKVSKSVVDFTFHNSDQQLPPENPSYMELMLNTGLKEENNNDMSQYISKSRSFTPLKNKKIMVSALNTPSVYSSNKHSRNNSKTEYLNYKGESTKKELHYLERINSQSAQEEETPIKRAISSSFHNRKRSENDDYLKGSLKNESLHRRNKTSYEISKEIIEASTIDLKPLADKVHEIQESLDDIQSRVFKTLKSKSTHYYTDREPQYSILMPNNNRFTSYTRHSIQKIKKKLKEKEIYSEIKKKIESKCNIDNCPFNKLTNSCMKSAAKYKFEENSIDERFEDASESKKSHKKYPSQSQLRDKFNDLKSLYFETSTSAIRDHLKTNPSKSELSRSEQICYLATEEVPKRVLNVKRLSEV